MPKSPALLEDLLAAKKGLGGEYRFERDTLEVKPNRQGITGVFARRAIAAGTDIISVPVVNGSMTPFRAFEEARELLQRLGPSRFNVSQEFAIAAAIYLRCVDGGNAGSDVLITGSDLAASYAGSPMTSYDSLARAKLLHGNNRGALEYAAEMDRQIGRLEVDPRLFRAILGYISSRAWKGVGVIPVLDWFNAVYMDAANCTFQMKDGLFRYVAIKDIAPGEELLWNYNNANAVTTWLNYGYVDVERPTLAFLETRLDEAQRDALEGFAIRSLDLTPNKTSSNGKVDKLLFQRELLTPGKMANAEDLRRSISACMTSFAGTRAWYRMLVMSADDTAREPVSVSDINADSLAFGPEVEARVISTMRASLATGLESLLGRVTEFSRTEVGRAIDMGPFVEMATGACSTWDKALAIAEAACTAGSMEQCIPHLETALGLDLGSTPGPGEALAELETRKPSLLVSMARSYLNAVHLRDRPARVPA
jgi:hypothetical protein